MGFRRDGWLVKEGACGDACVFPPLCQWGSLSGQKPPGPALKAGIFHMALGICLFLREREAVSTLAMTEALVTHLFLSQV